MLIIIAAMTLIVTTVSANPPDRFVVYDDTPYILADCGDFLVENQPDYTFQITLFYDNDGNLEKVHQLWYGDDVLVNMDTNQSISSSFHNSAVIYPNEVTVHQGGVFWHITLPHQGLVFFQSGHYIAIDYDQNPPTEETFTGVTNLDGAALCSLLSD